MHRRFRARHVFGILSAGVILVGIAHLPIARPLLARFAAYSGCPLALHEADAKTLETYRVRIARARAGARTARSRPALAFDLGNVFRQAVMRWLDERRAQCDARSAAPVVHCVLSMSGGKIDAHLQFDERDRLVAVDLWHSPSPAEHGLAAMNARCTSLDESVGAATSPHADLTAQEMEAQPFRRVAQEYRYADYSARVSLTNLGKHGIRLREQYQWIPRT
jgi:hypothetical protein